jgi:predicted RND superfamily exporter protein
MWSGKMSASLSKGFNKAAWKETMLKSSIAKRLMLAGVAVGLLAAPAQAQLDTALSIAKSSTAAAASSQRQVEQLDDQADNAVREYRAVLQQKDNIELFVAQQDIFRASQESEIASLRRQLGTVEQIKQGMSPMMLKMAAALEDSIRADLPFNINERLARIDSVKSVLGNPNISPAEQYRRVLNAYKIEVTYGMGIDSYEGAHPTKAGNVVNFIRFGRTSLVYVSKDEKDIAIYNLETKSWDNLEGADAIQLRQATRIAKGEAAPGLVFAPVVAGK